MFQLHVLSVNTLTKIRRFINKIIIEQEYSLRHLTKNALFDIQSLVDQLYQLRSTIPDGFDLRKIYFSQNLVPDLLDKGIK